MKQNRSFSILYPGDTAVTYKVLSPTACHDLGLDTLVQSMTSDNSERTLLLDILSHMTADPRVAAYRTEIFSDILRLPKLREQLLGLFDRLEFIRNFGSMHKDSDERVGIWHLLHRTDELSDYIECIETMRTALADTDLHAEGLLAFHSYIDELYDEAGFAEMKADIAELKQKSANIQSVTLGINVNERFEAVSVGLVSVNDKPFKKSGIVSSFADKLSAKDKIQKGSDWNGDMHYQQIEKLHDSAVTDFISGLVGMQTAQSNPFMDAHSRSTLVNVPQGDGVANSTYYLDTILGKMLDSLVKKLRDTLSKYADIAIVNISELIPEFLYYIRFAEFIEAQTAKGYTFCAADLLDDTDCSMQANGFYNLKLAISLASPAELVPNDLIFDTDHAVYLLTGANRGGKTTVTQAVGLLFALAQGGIHVPAEKFAYRPVDCIYTHFPADEDKTMDLGRLGEECKRFKELYAACTKDSLLLLNETFSTTSFEEGYFIARDSVRAMLDKQVRAIYNTHMHKLAAEAPAMNEGRNGAKAASLIVLSEQGKRSFKIAAAAPEGFSYAKDIAEKYGVTYEMLTSAQNSDT